MAINICILNSSSKLRPFRSRIKSITKLTEISIKNTILIGNIDIVFYANPSATIKKSGIRGSTPCANTIFISLNPDCPKFDKNLENDLTYTLCHEISHAIRFRTPIAKATLLEAIISEGLADHFAMEMTKRRNPPAWSIALTHKQKIKFMKKASMEWNTPSQYYYTWFYGSKRRKIPRWTAYTLGYELIAVYLQKNPGMTASKIISYEASRFI